MITAVLLPAVVPVLLTLHPQEAVLPVLHILRLQEVVLQVPLTLHLREAAPDPLTRHLRGVVPVLLIPLLPVAVAAAVEEDNI